MAILKETVGSHGLVHGHLKKEIVQSDFIMHGHVKGDSTILL